MAKGSRLPTYSIPAFGLVLMVLLWGGLFQQDRRADRLHEDGFSLELKNYARLFEAHTFSVIRGLDQVVTHLKAEYEDDPKKFDLKAQVARSPILKGLSVQVGIIGADGMLAASTSAFKPPVDLSDREHFVFHRDGDGGELFISKPVLGRASGKWSIQLARRLNRSDGGFAGVIVVSLSPDYIADIYDRIELGPNSAIAVLGRDGIVRARAAGQDRTVGQSFAGVPFFPTLWTQEEGVVRAVSPIDGQARIGAFRTLSQYPLAVIVSRAESDLAGLRADDHQTLFFFGWAGTLVILVGSMLLNREMLRQRATEAKLLAARTELEQRNRDLERFSEVLAHHLQEPVRLQHGFAQRLAQLLGGDLDDETRRALDYVLAGAARQRSLLHDVELYLSLDRMPPEPGPCDVRIADGKVRDALSDRLGDAEIVLDCADGATLPIGPRRGIDLLTVLIGNALTYRRPEVPARIRIEVKAIGRHALLSVIDNGMGIEPAFRERVFDVFERLHANNEISGTGIGLSLARKIVEGAGGRIWIDDGVDGGVALRVSLANDKD